MTIDDVYYEYHSGNFAKLSLSPAAVKELTEQYGIERELFVCAVYVFDNGDIELEKVCIEKDFIDRGKLKLNDTYHRDIFMEVIRRQKV